MLVHDGVESTARRVKVRKTITGAPRLRFHRGDTTQLATELCHNKEGAVTLHHLVLDIWELVSAVVNRVSFDHSNVKASCKYLSIIFNL